MEHGCQPRRGKRQEQGRRVRAEQRCEQSGFPTTSPVAYYLTKFSLSLQVFKLTYLYVCVCM